MFLKKILNAKKNFDRIKELRQIINKENSELSSLEIRLELLLESKKDLESSYAHIDTEQVRFLYERAKGLIPSIQKSFEDILAFHNEMVANKFKFITEDLQGLKEDIRTRRSILSDRWKALEAMSKKSKWL